MSEAGAKQGACRACGCPQDRRQAIGRISAAALAAIAGVALDRGTAGAVPVSEGTGTEAGSSELRYPLPAADGVTIDHQNQVIVVRLQGKVYAFNLACPHENTALRWLQGELRFRCPRHESRYQPDGTFVSGRATRNMDRFAVRRDGATLVVELNQLFRSDQQPQQWASAAVAL